MNTIIRMYALYIFNWMIIQIIHPYNITFWKLVFDNIFAIERGFTKFLYTEGFVLSTKTRQ